MPKLRSVDDAVTNTALHDEDLEDQVIDNYSYDDIGNLSRDVQEDIAKIEWTVYGKVRAVTRNEGSTKPDLLFHYDASGNRVTKTSIKGSDITRTYYLRDAGGNVMGTYETIGISSSPRLREQYLYGNSRIGVFENGNRSYELTDHLGNVRTVVNELKEVKAAYEYYAFGMSLAKIDNGYRYGFNGFEKVNEINVYDMGARKYDPRLAKTLSPDPAFKEYPSLSHYSGFGNNPIIFIDPDDKRIYFVPGLGYDASKGDANSPYARSTGIPASLAPYLEGHGTYSKTIQGSKGGRITDMLYVAWRGQRPRLNVSHDKRAMMIAYSIAADLTSNPLKEGEQMNILATSQGTISTAHAAIAMLEDPSKFGLDENFTIDNLVLAGSPLNPESKLFKKLESLKEQGKIKNIEYETYQAEGDVVSGLAGKSRGGALLRGFGYIGKIIQAIGQYKRGEELTDPHIRAAENMPIDPDSGKTTFGDELQQRLEGDEIH